MLSNWVISITEDTTGHIWFGGSSGLTRYDGRICKHFRSDPTDPHSLSANSITHLFYDKKNHWILCSTLGGGISIKDISTGQFHNILPEKDYGYPVFDIMGGVLAGNGFYYFLPYYFYPFIIKVEYKNGEFINEWIHLKGVTSDIRLGENYSMNMIADPMDSNVLLVSLNHILYSLDLTSYQMKELVVLETSNRQSIVSDHIVSMGLSANHQLSIVTNQRGLIQIDLDTYEISREICPEGVSCIFKSLHVDVDGNHYFGNDEGKIFTYSQLENRYQELQFDIYNFENYLVKSIYKSKQEVLFLAIGQGLFKYDFTANRFNTVFNQYHTDDGMKELFFRSGYLHPEKPLFYVDVYNDNRIFIVDCLKSEIQALKGSENLTEEKVLYAPWDHTNILILEGYDFYTLSANHDQLIPVKVSGVSDFLKNVKKEVLQLYTNEENTIAVVGKDWIYLYVDESSYYLIEPRKYEETIASNIQGIHFDSDQMLIVFNDEVYVFELGSKQFKKIPIIGLPFNHNPKYRNILRLKDKYYISSFASGFYVLEMLNDTLNIITNYREDNSIVSNQIIFSSMATDSTIWLATDMGIARYDPSTEGIMVFSYDHNLKEANIFRPLFVNHYGLVATQTILEIIWSDVSLLKDIKENVKLHIHSFTINDKELIRGITPVSGKAFLFHHHQNSFKIGWSLLQASRPSYYDIEYKLDGFDEDWRRENGKLEAIYTSIPPGQYDFQIKVHSRLDNKLLHQVSLPIIIRKPFYFENWFLVLLLLIITGIFSFIYRWRINNIKNEEAIKTAYNKQLADLELQSLRARMNPHFMFNSLNSIKLYILKNEKEKAADYLTGFSKLIRSILLFSSEKFITLKEELETIIQYANLEKMRILGGFTLDIKMKSSTDPAKILIQPLILQPFVENAIWHGLMPMEKDRQLIISIDQKENTLIIIIEDNGIGRKKAAQFKHQNSNHSISKGIEITTSRLKALDPDSDVQIDDLLNNNGEASGTRITLYLPYLTNESTKVEFNQRN